MQELKLMRKKVLFLITKGNFGGAQRYVYDLATNLPKTKYEAVVACGEGDALPHALTEAGIRVVRLTTLQRDIKVSGEWESFKTLYRLLKAEKPDIFHVNSSKAGGLGTLAGRIVGVPRIIFTAHGWASNESRTNLQKSVILFLHWLTVLFSHKTIAVSYKSRHDISFLPFMKNRIVVVHNGIEPFETLPREEARKILTGEEVNNKTILFSLSELHKNKGVDVALRGIKKLPEDLRQNIMYCVAGTGEEKETLEKLAQELGIGNQVRFLGLVPDAKKLLSGADIFILSSRTEALPYAILEAGLSHLPIIATNVGGIAEVVTDMKSGILVHKENPKEIAEGLTYFLHNPKRQFEFGEKIQTNVLRHFSKKKMITETTSLYR